MLTETEVHKIAVPILNKQLSSEGLSDAKIAFEYDFDDEPIIRIEAILETPTPRSERLLASADAIRSALLALGDERFVFVSQASPAMDQLDVEEEEIADENLRQ